MSNVRRSNALQVTSDHHLPYQCDPTLVACDSRTELIAVINSDNVDIYRLGGQRAFHLEGEHLSGRPTCLRWIDEGDVLLIGNDAGAVDELYTRDSKLPPSRKRKHNPSEVARPAITGIGSLQLDFDTRSRKRHAPHAAPRRRAEGNAADGESVTAWFDRLDLSHGDNASFEDRHKTTGAKQVKSLPQHLAQIDAADVLPRLSAIPGASKAGPGMPVPVIKSQQPHTQLLLAKKGISNAAKVTFVSHEDGMVTGSVADLLPHEFPNKSRTDRHDICLHAFGDEVDRYGILYGRLDAHKDSAGTGSQGLTHLSLCLYQVPFVSAGGLHTGVILQHAAQLHRLQMYLTQCIETITADWSTLTALPARFIANINETLAEKQQSPLDHELYQLLLTGHCSDTVLEWLKDDLGERGHKRWDHAMTTFYSAVTHLLEINVLPALERCAMSASTLRGLSLYYDGSNTFDVPAALYTKVIESIGCMHMLAHEALQILGQEGRQFKAFSQWFRNQVDLAAAEPGSQAAAETADRDASTTEVAKALEYLEGAFTKSKLVALLGRKLSSQELEQANMKADSGAEDTAKAIKQHRIADTVEDDYRTYVPLHMLRLQQSIEACSTQMRKWQSATWLPPETVDIDCAGMGSNIDIRADNATAGPEDAFIIAGSDAKDKSKLHIHRVTTSSGVGQSLKDKRGPSVSHRTIELSGGATILDAKLLINEDLVVLASWSDASAASEQKTFALLQLTRSTHSPRQNSADPLRVDEALKEQTTVHAFRTTDGFTPAHLIISAGSGRQSVLVLDASRQRWQILRLPDHIQNRKTSGEGEDEVEEPQSPFGIHEEEDSMLVD